MSNNEQFPKPGDMVLGTPHLPQVKTSAPNQPRPDDAVLGFMPSAYQKDIFDWIKNGGGSCVVSAVPGSGKTTTLVKGVNYIPKSLRSKFLAFNQHVAKELSSKLPKNIKCSTIHSLGLASIIREFRGVAPEVNSQKYTHIIKAYLKERKIFGDGDATKTIFNELKILTKFTQLSLIDYNQVHNLEWLNTHYNLGLSEDWYFYRHALENILERGISERREVISYEDMVWLPCWLDYQVPSSDFLFVDEAQDLNRCQLELVLKSQKTGSRGIYVGDKYQAIMGFSGADHRSIAHIVRRTKALELPLSISYRCPSSHIDLANKIHNVIEPRPNAPDGKISKIQINEIASVVSPKDLIICRCLYPLIPVYYSLLQDGIPAEIKNKDMGGKLISLIEKIFGEEEHRHTKTEFADTLKEWYENQKREMIDKKMAMTIIIDLHEQILTLASIYSMKKCVSTTELKTEIEKISRLSNNAERVYLTTIHGAKGLEAEKVFVIRPDLMPHPKVEKDWELAQEYNLKFVALTRAKQELFFCNE